MPPSDDDGDELDEAGAAALAALREELDDDDDDGHAAAPEAPSPARAPAAKPRGKCEICGEAARTPRSIRCETHRIVRRDRRPQPRPSGTPSPTRTASLEVELRTQLEFAATLWAMRDPQCASVLLPPTASLRVVAGFKDDGAPILLELKGQGHAAAIAHFWAERAASNPAVARVLEGLTSSGGWLGGISVHAPLVMAIWAHHVAPAMARRQEAQLEADAEAGAGGDEMPGRPYGPTPEDLAAAAANGGGPTTSVEEEPPAGWPAGVPWPPP